MSNKGGQLQSLSSFVYGRFETMVKPSFGSGVVSSFFLFYDGVDYQKNWSEIDFEFLGRNTNQIDTNIIRTIGNVTDKNRSVKKYVLERRSEDVFWKLCIEWAPTKVVWKINDIIVREFEIDASMAIPKKIMINIWNGSPSWAGELNDNLLPQQVEYKYVRYSEYSGGKFKLAWQDDFKTIDLKRWYVAKHPLGNTAFVKENTYIENGNLILRLNV